VQTTQPGVRFTLQVAITDSQIQLLPHKTATGQLLHTYIQDGGRVARFPRGTLVEFVFTNTGTKTYLPAIRVTNGSQASPLTPPKPLYTASHAIRPVCMSRCGRCGSCASAMRPRAARH
jgi:hypothetical protein